MIYSKSRTSWRWRPQAFALVQNGYVKIIIASNFFQNTLSSIGFPVWPTHWTEYEWTYFRAGGTCRKLQWKLVNKKKIDRSHMKLKNASWLQWTTKIIQRSDLNANCYYKSCNEKTIDYHLQMLAVSLNRELRDWIETSKFIIIIE